MRSLKAMNREQQMVQEYGLDGLVDLRMCGERGVAKGCKWDDTLKRCLCPGYSKAPDDEVSIPTPVNPPRRKCSRANPRSDRESIQRKHSCIECARYRSYDQETEVK